MLSDFGLGLILPASFLALAGWYVPKWLRWRMPEGVRPLIMLAVVAALITLIIGALVFLGLYIVQGADLEVLLSEGIWPAIGYFLRLSVSSAILWGPLLVLSVAGLPRTWVKETW